jgi:ACS family hexuronate transporter-like MFS transporter
MKPVVAPCPVEASLSARRWWIAALLFLATVLNYIDRQVFSVLAPVFTEELRISEMQYGFLVQAFLVPYTVMFLISGYWIDRVGTRKGLASFIGFWSAAAALHAATRGALSLGVFRFLLGAGEAGNYTASAKAVSEWFPPKERSLATGIYSSGTAIGAIICPPLVVWLALTLGWRRAFLPGAIAGFLWLIPWFLLNRRLQDAAAAEEGSRPQPARPVRDMVLMFRNRHTQGLFWARVIAEPLWWFYLFWLPKYLKDVQHFTLKEIGYTVWVPYAAADVGAILGGLASGALIRRGMAPVTARKAIMLPCALIMPLGLLLLANLPSVAILALISLATFAHMAWKVNLMTLTNDLFEDRCIATVSGILAFGSGVGGIAFAGFAGFAISHYSYAFLFALVPFLHPAAFVLLHLRIAPGQAAHSTETARRQQGGGSD